MTSIAILSGYRSLRRRLAGLLLSVPLSASAQQLVPTLDWHELLTDPDPVRITALARRYERAEGYRRDYGRARQLYCAAARLSHPPAQMRLAWMYANGLGAPRDTDLAAAWLEVAAASGDLKARRYLAFVGAPNVKREPRCTYESRYDAYAIADVWGESGLYLNTPEREQIAECGAWRPSMAWTQS